MFRTDGAQFLMMPTRDKAATRPDALKTGSPAGNRSIDAFEQQLQELERAFDRGSARPAGASGYRSDITAASPRPSVSHRDASLTQIESRVAALLRELADSYRRAAARGGIAAPYVPVDVEYKLLLSGRRE